MNRWSSVGDRVWEYVSWVICLQEVRKWRVMESGIPKVAGTRRNRENCATLHNITFAVGKAARDRRQ